MLRSLCQGTLAISNNPKRFLELGHVSIRLSLLTTSFDKQVKFYLIL